MSSKQETGLKAKDARNTKKWRARRIRTKRSTRTSDIRSNVAQLHYIPPPYKAKKRREEGDKTKERFTQQRRTNERTQTPERNPHKQTTTQRRTATKEQETKQRCMKQPCCHCNPPSGLQSTLRRPLHSLRCRASARAATSPRLVLKDKRCHPLPFFTKV